MELLFAGSPVNIEYRVNPRKDFKRWVWVQAQPVIEDGEVVRIVGFSRDITKRRRRERQLQVMDTLLRHNLRNDMNVILGHADLASRSDDPSVTEHMDIIRKICESSCKPPRNSATSSI